MQPAPPSAATATSNVQEISSARAGSTLGDTFDDKPGEVFKKVAAIGRLRGRLCQSALLDDKACDLIDTFAALQIRKMKGRFARILSASASITSRFAPTNGARLSCL
jgi:hypothetical protein